MRFAGFRGRDVLIQEEHGDVYNLSSCESGECTLLLSEDRGDADDFESDAPSHDVAELDGMYIVPCKRSQAVLFIPRQQHNGTAPDQPLFIIGTGRGAPVSTAVHAQGNMLFVLYNTKVDVYSMAKGPLEWKLLGMIDISSLPLGKERFMSVKEDTGDLLVGSCEGKVLIFSREEGPREPCFRDVRMRDPWSLVQALEISRRKARGQRAESRITQLLADLHCMMALGCSDMSRGMMHAILSVQVECERAVGEAECLFPAAEMAHPWGGRCPFPDGTLPA
jgi:hypothetical protein